MICCSECFTDIELKPIIEGLGNKGDCPTCGCTNTYLYDTDINFELTDYFDELISIYKPVDLLPNNYPKADVKLLKDEMLINWNIFNNLNSNQIYNLITNICKEKYSQSPNLFDSSVGIDKSNDEEYLKEKSLLRTNKWSDFVNALKNENRFHTNFFNTDILEMFCSYIRKPYKKGATFYRGRISSASGFSKNEMGAPPHHLASAGRANSMGIRCLYLADDIDTTLREVRAGLFDYVSIGTFVLQEDIIVVDFKAIDKISPFFDGINSTQYAINREHLKKINNEMAKVLRRNDSQLDYVPTQYISDFIKSIVHNEKFEYAGIEYNSTMNNNKGTNLAIFYPDLFECIAVNTFKIDNLYYCKDIVR